MFGQQICVAARTSQEEFWSSEVCQNNCFHHNFDHAPGIFNHPLQFQITITISITITILLTIKISITISITIMIPKSIITITITISIVDHWDSLQ